MHQTLNHLAVTACCVAAVAVAATAAAQATEAAPADTRSAAGAAPGARFDGYLFRDADGQPLPFQSDEAIENFLETAEVLSSTKIPVGVTAPRKALLEADGVRACAAFKSIDEKHRNVHDRTSGATKFYLVWRDWYGYDIAAYRVNQLLGLDRVPPIVERSWGRRKGSMQIWLTGVMTEAKRIEDGIEPPDIARWNQQHSILHVFDNLVANRDSNLGNLLIDENWRTWFIDCSRCFGNSGDLLYPQLITHCERGLWEALKNLDRDRATERLRPFLDGNEIAALFMRRDKLVELIQGLIDKWGEEMIIFDVRPNTADVPQAGE